MCYILIGSEAVEVGGTTTGLMFAIMDDKGTYAIYVSDICTYDLGQDSRWSSVGI